MLRPAQPYLYLLWVLLTIVHFCAPMDHDSQCFTTCCCTGSASRKQSPLSCVTLPWCLKVGKIRICRRHWVHRSLFCVHAGQLSSTAVLGRLFDAGCAVSSRARSAEEPLPLGPLRHAPKHSFYRRRHTHWLLACVASF